MAMEFNNAAVSYVAIGSNAALNGVAGASLMGWGKPNVADSNLAYFSENGSAETRLSIYFSATTIRGYARRLDGDARETCNAGAWVPGTLYHVVAVADFANGVFALYVDGALVTTLPVAGWIGNCSATDSTAYISFRIMGRAFDGPIDDVRCYARVLSAAEIATIYAARGRDRIVDGLVGRWKLTEAEPTAVAAGAGSVRDSGPLGLHGTPANNPVYAEALVSALHSRRR